MARGVNKVILIGHLGKNPEVRTIPSGDSVCNFSIATSENWTDKNGDRQERTEWHSIVVFKKLAEICGQYLQKGSKVYVEGALRTRKWQDKESGKDRYSTEIVIHEMQMLDGKPDGTQQRPAEANRGYADATGRSGRAPQQAAPTHDTGFEDDDIPF